MESNLTVEQCIALAEEAQKNAEEAYKNSEYPRLGKAAYLELAAAYVGLTQVGAGYTPKNDSPYEQKKAARVERMRRRAAWLRVEAARKAVQSHNIGRNIPFGQPILVGHHSERVS